MKLVALISLLLSFSVFAKDKFDLNLDVLLDGEKITSGRIIALEGQEATLEKVDNDTKAKTLIKMIATCGEIQERKGILVKLKIDHTKLGNRQVREQEILVSENQLAGMEVGDTETGKQDLKISLLVKKIK